MKPTQPQPKQNKTLQRYVCILENLLIHISPLNHHHFWGTVFMLTPLFSPPYPFPTLWHACQTCQPGPNRCITVRIIAVGRLWIRNVKHGRPKCDEELYSKPERNVCGSIIIAKVHWSPAFIRFYMFYTTKLNKSPDNKAATQERNSLNVRMHWRMSVVRKYLPFLPQQLSIPDSSYLAH